MGLDSKVDLIDIVGMGFWGAHVQQISAKDFSQMFFFMINSLNLIHQKWMMIIYQSINLSIYHYLIYLSIYLV